MGEIEIAGWESKLIEAPEPTNVIWENRDFDKTVRWFRLTCIILLVAFVLLLTFLATVQAKILTNELTGKYDTSINCKELDTMYDKKTLEELASDEWVDFYKKSTDDSDRQIAPTLSCFCNDQYVELGSDVAEMDFKSSDGKVVKTCSEYFSDRDAIGLVAMGVSSLIVGVNFALKVILQELIKSLRLKTVTLETNYTMITIFIGQFVNTAILIVLNNASFKDFDGGRGPLSMIFRVGTETDFSVNWYRNVGTTIMRTMISQAIWPLIEFAMFYSLAAFTRCLDRRWGNDTFITKTPSVQAYIDLYAGPIYLIHYRYALILLQIGVAFMYGCTMPPLYAIACLAFVILYINERCLVCYYYREPPAFDEKMTMLTLDIIKWVPFIMLPMSFWQLGNRQIFESVTTEIEFRSDVKLSQHYLTTALTHMDPRFLTYNSGPLWLMLIIILIMVYKSCMNALADEIEEEEQLFEGLKDYQEALKDDDKNIIIGEEEYYKRKYNVQAVSTE